MSSCNLGVWSLAKTGLFSICRDSVLPQSDDLLRVLCLMSYSGSRCHCCYSAPMPQTDNHPVTRNNVLHWWQNRGSALMQQSKPAVLWAQNWPSRCFNPERSASDSGGNRWGQTLLCLIRAEMIKSLEAVKWCYEDAFPERISHRFPLPFLGDRRLLADRCRLWLWKASHHRTTQSVISGP